MVSNSVFAEGSLQTAVFRAAKLFQSSDHKRKTLTRKPIDTRSTIAKPDEEREERDGLEVLDEVGR